MFYSNLVSEIFDFKNAVTLKSGLGVRQTTKLLLHTNRKPCLTYGMLLCLVTLADL